MSNLKPNIEDLQKLLETVRKYREFIAGTKYGGRIYQREMQSLKVLLRDNKTLTRHGMGRYTSSTFSRKLDRMNHDAVLEQLRQIENELEQRVRNFEQQEERQEEPQVREQEGADKCATCPMNQVCTKMRSGDLFGLTLATIRLMADSEAMEVVENNLIKAFILASTLAYLDTHNIHILVD